MLTNRQSFREVGKWERDVLFAGYSSHKICQPKITKNQREPISSNLLSENKQKNSKMSDFDAQKGVDPELQEFLMVEKQKAAVTEQVNT